MKRVLFSLMFVLVASTLFSQEIDKYEIYYSTRADNFLNISVGQQAPNYLAFIATDKTSKETLLFFQDFTRDDTDTFYGEGFKSDNDLGFAGSVVDPKYLANYSLEFIGLIRFLEKGSSQKFTTYWGYLFIHEDPSIKKIFNDYYKSLKE